jgi:hypothetical protein
MHEILPHRLCARSTVPTTYNLYDTLCTTKLNWRKVVHIYDYDIFVKQIRLQRHEILSLSFVNRTNPRPIDSYVRTPVFV